VHARFKQSLLGSEKHAPWPAEPPAAPKPVITTVPAERLHHVNDALLAWPDDLTPNPRPWPTGSVFARFTGLTPGQPLRLTVTADEDATFGLVVVEADRSLTSLDPQLEFTPAAAELDIVVVNFGPDGYDADQDWHGYGYTLVADPEDLFSRALDALVEKSMYGKKYIGPARAAYVLDAAGTLRAVIPKVEAAAHGRQVLDALATI
jgi:hypothetical protein